MGNGWCADLSPLGMPQKRKATLRETSRQVDSGTLSLDAAGDLPSFIRTLTALPGIGDWTANYIAMRALGEPDAFPASDLGIRSALGQGANRPSAHQAMARAETWRPWRAYAAVYLWMGGAIK